MPIVVKAVPKDEFIKWLDTQEAALTPPPAAAATAAASPPESTPPAVPAAPKG
jgi:heme/copper-type cytochrome/quinol oxidase subunit 2